ncbi:transcriptional regulation of mitochondrial recombination-domain-containing protein [Lineolata rhizophorae]|uniref:Large ribosomal subunit protein mL67 n=1 Tax=Lineolata rhizophorae TaxID=578093 RepID=A0A6A6NMI8_9PEZI|nr:transcriptional regulation of mitochondrial recombination-domain-containing protein [Lineolata rhizophorae]
MAVPRAVPSALELAAHKAQTVHGKHIYIYCSQKNQIIYSLTREMKEKRAIKQLPYLGKKTIGSPTLRRDFWRPLAIVSFPSAQQGISAYRRLREYRMQRLANISTEELNARPDLAGRPELGRDYEEGKPLTRKQRGRLLVDYKGYCVADLADVLGKQDEYGRKVEEEWEEKWAKERETRLKRMTEKVEFLVDEAKMERLRLDLSKTEQAVERLGEGGAEKVDDAKIKRKHLLRKIHTLRDRLAELRRLGAELRDWRKETGSQTMDASAIADALIASRDATERARLQQERQVLLDEEADINENNVAEDGPLIEEFPTGARYILTPGRLPKPGRNLPPAPKEHRDPALPLVTPVFSTQGVLIRWADIEDAEFAEAWPEDVEHEYMGLTRLGDAAPHADKEAVWWEELEKRAEVRGNIWDWRPAGYTKTRKAKVEEVVEG